MKNMTFCAGKGKRNQMGEGREKKKLGKKCEKEQNIQNRNLTESSYRQLHWAGSRNN